MRKRLREKYSDAELKELYLALQLTESDHATGRGDGAVIDDPDRPAEHGKAERRADLGGLADTEQLRGGLGEQVLRGAFREAFAVEGFDFIEAELGQPHRVAPDLVGFGLVVVHDGEMVVGQEAGHRAILPVRGIHVGLRCDVIGCALCQQGEAAREAGGKQDHIGHVPVGHDGGGDRSHDIVFPGQTFHDIGGMRGRQRHHDVALLRSPSGRASLPFGLGG